MSTKQVSPFLKAWYKWKTLPLPWRREVLVGQDLNGNTYWQFRDAGASAETARMRRIVKCPPRTHPGDVVIPPAWHQWLRQTRATAPTLGEQHADVARQMRIKVLAAEADARWAAKPSLSDPPPSQQAAESTPGASDVSADGAGDAAKKAPETSAADAPGADDTVRVGASGDRKESWRKLQEDEKARKAGASKPNDPWKRARGGPSEEWQPKGWNPSAGSKRW